MSDPRSRPSGTGLGALLLGLGMVVAAVGCCAGPALLAGGALAVLGGALGSPAVLAGAALVLAAALGYALRRRIRPRGTGMLPAPGVDEVPHAGEGCCAPATAAAPAQDGRGR